MYCPFSLGLLSTLALRKSDQDTGLKLLGFQEGRGKGCVVLNEHMVFANSFDQNCSRATAWIIPYKLA